MRMVAHGVVWFEPADKDKIIDLMRAQCSAMRSAYQAIHKHGLSGNDVRKYVKQNYMDTLSQRYVSDAVSRASQIKDDGVIFGGRRLWEKLQNGSITSKQWQRIRNSQIYSRGDRSKKGNPNIRIDQEAGKLWVNDPSKRGKWIEGSLYLPDKWAPDTDCYSIQILLRKGEFRVKALWEEAPPEQIDTGGRGTVGVDVNPDGVALTEVSEDGNLLSHRYIQAQRIQFADENKRDYDVRQLAVEVVSEAKEAGKVLVLERLDFGKTSNSTKKFNRMRHNFLHRQILDAIKSKAEREGIPVRGINPAFTSILGKLKYEEMYSLSTHAAAAFVIARRGLGLKERQDFTVTLKQDSGSNNRVNLEGRSREHTLSQKAYSFLSGRFLKDKAAKLTASSLAPGLKPGTCDSAGEIPAGESQPTTGRLRKEISNFFMGEEGHPFKPA